MENRPTSAAETVYDGHITRLLEDVSTKLDNIIKLIGISEGHDATSVLQRLDAMEKVIQTLVSGSDGRQRHKDILVDAGSLNTGQTLSKYSATHSSFKGASLSRSRTDITSSRPSSSIFFPSPMKMLFRSGILNRVTSRLSLNVTKGLDVNPQPTEAAEIDSASKMQSEDTMSSIQSREDPVLPESSILASSSPANVATRERDLVSQEPTLDLTPSKDSSADPVYMHLSAAYFSDEAETVTPQVRPEDASEHYDHQDSRRLSSPLSSLSDCSDSDDASTSTPYEHARGLSGDAVSQDATSGNGVSSNQKNIGVKRSSARPDGPVSSKKRRLSGSSSSPVIGKKPGDVFPKKKGGWPKGCIPQKKYSLMFVGCDNCNAWIHYGCAGIESDAQAKETYVCPPCQEAPREEYIRRRSITVDSSKCARPDCLQKSSNDNVYTVERIMGRRPRSTSKYANRSHRYHWLVKYEGYSSIYNEWVTEENLGFSDELMNQFEREAVKEGFKDRLRDRNAVIVLTTVVSNGSET